MPFFPIFTKRNVSRRANAISTGGNGNAGLSRTTLQLSEADSPLSFVRAIDELKRVPGVLTAELDVDTDRAIVAHDAGVGASSLLAAARRGGIRARILNGPPPATIGFDVMIVPFGAWSRFLLALAAAACAATALTNLVFSGDARFFAPAFLISLGLVVSIETIVRRSRRR